MARSKFDILRVHVEVMDLYPTLNKDRERDRENILLQDPYCEAHTHVSLCSGRELVTFSFFCHTKQSLNSK